MKTTFRLLTITAMLLGLARVSSANAIVNGSFEDPNLGTSWNVFAAIPGWVANPGDLIEIGDISNYGVVGHIDGHQVMELDAYQNASVNQGSLVVTPGSYYTLSFYYGDRIDGTHTATFEVYWNGGLITPAIFPNNSNVMTLFSTTVLAGVSNTLQFRGTGTSDGYGAIIDDVQLNVPDGGLTSALLGLSIVGLGMVRRIIR